MTDDDCRQLQKETKRAMSTMPQKYANETVWYTFYSDVDEKREYFYEPSTKTAIWVKPTQSVATPEQQHKQKHEQEHRPVLKPDRSPIRTNIQPSDILEKASRLKTETRTTDATASLDSTECVARWWYQKVLFILTLPWVATIMLLVNILLMILIPLLYFNRETATIHQF